MTDERKLCPREPTDAMLDAGKNHHWPQEMGSERMAMLWRAMYDAVPASAAEPSAVGHCPECGVAEGRAHRDRCPLGYPDDPPVAEPPQDVAGLIADLSAYAEDDSGHVPLGPRRAMREAAAALAALQARIAELEGRK